jgi:hypothetical protein
MNVSTDRERGGVECPRLVVRLGVRGHSHVSEPPSEAGLKPIPQIGREGRAPPRRRRRAGRTIRA